MAVNPRIDWFRDPRLVDDPYPYFNASRGKCPVEPEDHYGVTMITGWEEAVAALETGNGPVTDVQDDKVLSSL